MFDCSTAAWLLGYRTLHLFQPHTALASTATLLQQAEIDRVWLNNSCEHGSNSLN